jgi:hypothetical protein
MTATATPPGLLAEMPSLSPDLAVRLGVIAPGIEEPEPTTPMDYALLSARRGWFIFPAERFLGLPLVPKWHSVATIVTSTIVEWWSQWPEADIAGVPDRSRHFVIVAVREQGGDIALMDLEDELGELPAEFRYVNRWGDEHLWLRGSAMTSHHKIGRGLHVLGAGHYVYLPDSWAPCHVWK